MKILEFYIKTTSFWQALLRVGLPIIAMYRATHYLMFRLEKGNLRLHYPWCFALTVDVIAILALSTLWWSLMRSGFGRHRTRKDGDSGG